MPRRSETPAPETTPADGTPASGSAGSHLAAGRAAERASRIVFWIAAYLFLAYLFVKAYELVASDVLLPAQRIDFVAFWAAAKLTLAGEPLSAFDQVALTEAGGYPGAETGSFYWHYPPGFLLLIAPLGALPYWAAWIVFVLGSLVCLALAVRRPAEVLPGGWRLLTVAPVVLIGCLAIGQNSVLWTAALVAALWAMRRERPAAAGLWIALLTLKPQLGVLIPVALVAARQWRVIAWASGLAAALVVASTIPFGTAYWGHFLADLDGTVQRMEQGFVLPPLTSFYGFIRILGAGHEAALWAQLAVSVAVVAAIAWIWSRRNVSYDLKCAALCAAIPLVTPYAYYYEMVLTLAAAMFLVRDGFGRGAFARLWLLIVWFGPVPALYLPSVTTVAVGATPIVAVTTAICLIRAWRCDRAARSLDPVA